jgi:hypothetical protein
MIKIKKCKLRRNLSHVERESGGGGRALKPQLEQGNRVKASVSCGGEA